MKNTSSLNTFTSLISPLAFRLAKKVSSQQVTPQKSQQVFLNTLAVYFVKNYLEYMGFETDIKASDSMNPFDIMLADVADLVVKDLGKLECRPVLENEDFMYIPPEVQLDRISYLGVKINESSKSATILGFVSQVSTDYLPINQLQPLGGLLGYLENLQAQKTISDSKNSVNLAASVAIASRNTLVNLQKWLENIFDVDWEPIENLLVTEPIWQVRSLEQPRKVTERATLINFGLEGDNAKVVKVIRVIPDENNKEEMQIFVELHPAKGQEYLPPLLHVMILDEEGTSVLEAKAKNDNRKIELQFTGTKGDYFSVKLALDNISLTKDFVI